MSIDFEIDEMFAITTVDYDALKNKPQINDVELIGNISLEALGITILTNDEIDAIVDKEWNNIDE